MIGSCLAARYLEQGHEVTVYDNEETGSPQNLAYHLGPEAAQRIRITRGDVLDLSELSEALEGSDLCYHMAATLGTIKVVHQPRQMMKVNVVGTQNVLDLCVERRIPVVIASTSMVYGNNPSPVVREEDSLFVDGDMCKGLWWYAISKMADEAYARSAMLEEPEAKILIVRPFNVVAPVQSGTDGFVLPRFITAALEGLPLLVYGDGTQRRTFLWVTDFVDALMGVVEKETWNQTINIGCDEEITILDLAQEVVRLTESSSLVEMIEPQAIFRNQFAEIQRRVPDLSLLHGLVGKRKFTPISNIIQRFLDYYRSRCGQQQACH